MASAVPNMSSFFSFLRASARRRAAQARIRFDLAVNGISEDNQPMATLPKPEKLWTVEEYLRTSWSPDRELVEGRIEERNLGEKEHSILQAYVTYLFMSKRAEWKIEIFPELRTQTKATNFRVPDVLVNRAEDKFKRYVTRPPLIAIEILSPEDTMTAMRRKAEEYRLFGVENIWVIDPAKRVAYHYAGSGLEKVRTGELAVPGTQIRIVLSEMFAELDRD
jgi:Uma2 family endonuclease